LSGEQGNRSPVSGNLTTSRPSPAFGPASLLDRDGGFPIFIRDVAGITARAGRGCSPEFRSRTGPRAAIRRGARRGAMSQSYLSVDDWIERNCGPDENFMPALGRLRERLIGGELGVTSWRCTWDRYGRLMATDRVRQLIPPLAILDLKFDRRPPNRDIVLIPHNDWFTEEVSEPYRQTSGIRWLSEDGTCSAEPEGWAELYLHESGGIRLRSETDQAYSSSKAIQEAPVYRTGLAGKPTSWHVVQAECRRRWQAGERHPGKVGESRSDWARILVEWLKGEHPSAPTPTEKTLKSKLGGLLRELARTDHPAS
jgi:hypothetical protein